jgi:hypothetical protein
MMQSTGERWVHGVSMVYQADDAARNVQNGGHCVGAGNVQCNIFSQFLGILMAYIWAAGL